MLMLVNIANEALNWIKLKAYDLMTTITLKLFIFNYHKL